MAAKKRAVPPTAAPEKTWPAELTKWEKIMIAGLVARDRELQTIARPLQQDGFDLKRHIEERLGLDVGALDATHALNPEKGWVEEITFPEPPPEPAA